MGEGRMRMWRKMHGHTALLRRSLRPRADPLLRRSDRVEALLVVGVLVLAIALIPVAVWLGGRSGESQRALAQVQAREYSMVTATTVGAVESVSAPTDYVAVPVESAPATWSWGREIRRGDVRVDPDAPVGTRVQIWVDGHGDKAVAPITASAAATSAVVVGVFTWTSAMMAAGALAASARALLNRRRDGQWSRELAEFLGTAPAR
ncbi:hypothetical protein [Rhodococcus sp. NPDC127528]|uniref:Rv1733c family protein n=1 Tax=unclassified Rhodococcus (in: high G+C Gram-positive bacteria) TaxID=192944 RepID=UPI00362799B4